MTVQFSHNSQSEGEARYGDPHLKVKCRIWRSDFREKKFSYSLRGEKNEKESGIALCVLSDVSDSD